MQDISVKPKLHVFVCVNDRCNTPETAMPSCSPTITKAQVKEVKLWIREQGLINEVFCTGSHCLGFCSADGGNACAWPTGRYVKGVQHVEDIKQFILEEYNKVKK